MLQHVLDAAQAEPRLTSAVLTAATSADPEAVRAGVRLGSVIGGYLDVALGDGAGPERDEPAPLLGHVFFSALVHMTSGRLAPARPRPPSARRSPPLPGRSHPVKFALFYEIPVARPWATDREHQAYKNVLEQAVLGDQMGFDSRLDGRAPLPRGVLALLEPGGAVRGGRGAHEAIRIGYGVRLGPKPYNHPVRSAETAAVLDLLSDGRVEFGTGRSATRIEIEGFGIHPNETREMWQEAVGHIVTCWSEDETEFSGKHWQMPRRRVLPKPLQTPHPPVWGATGSADGHRMMGELGLGVFSFSVGSPPEELKQRIDIYRYGIARARSRSAAS